MTEAQLRLICMPDPDPSQSLDQNYIDIVPMYARYVNHK